MSTEALVPTNGPAALALAAELGATLTATSLEIHDPNMEFNAWENLGRCISFAGNAWQWWVGDWITIGETLYGEDAAQGIDDPSSRYDVMRRVTGVEQQTLLNVASICRRVHASRRKQALRFSHHAVVQSLDPDDQELWLDRAIENQWTVAELRAAIREDRNPTEPDPEPEPGITPSGGTDAPTLAERLEEAMRLLHRTRQPMDNGYWAPGSAWAQADAVLGES